MLDLNQMALFVQVVQAGSFAEASRRLGMPPTTLSRQVAQLEDSLQARLLQRTTRKLTLTDAGRTLFDQSAAQIATLQDAASALAGKDLAPISEVAGKPLRVEQRGPGINDGGQLDENVVDATAVADPIVDYVVALVRRTRGEYDEAETIFREILSIDEELGEEARTARTLYRYGIALIGSGS